MANKKPQSQGKILLVDDDPGLLRLLSIRLRAEGYEPLPAYTEPREGPLAAEPVRGVANKRSPASTLLQAPRPFWAPVALTSFLPPRVMHLETPFPVPQYHGHPQVLALPRSRLAASQRRPASAQPRSPPRAAVYPEPLPSAFRKHHLNSTASISLWHRDTTGISSGPSNTTQSVEVPPGTVPRRLNNNLPPAHTLLQGGISGSP